MLSLRKNKIMNIKHLKIIALILLILSFIIIYPNAYNNNIPYNFNNNYVKRFSNLTNIKIDHLSSIKEIIDINLILLNWSDIKWGYYPFKNDDYKKQIRNTKTLLLEIIFNNNISCGIKIANFNNPNDAKVGFFDHCNLYPSLINTFFSNNIISKNNIFGFKYLVGNKYAHLYLLHLNCACIIQFIKKDTTFIDKDFEFIDNIIKIFIELIEKSSI